MKKVFFGFLLLIISIFLPFLLYAGGTQPKINPDTASGVTGLISLDEAIDAAAKEMEASIAGGTEIAVYKITAPDDKIGDYFASGLNDLFAVHKKLVPLARETVLRYASTEQQFQLSGLVSDESAVSIGQYLGAKVVITGTFDRYADFSQLRLRAVDVRTSALVAAYTARIENKDPILVNITAPLGNSPLFSVSENALAALNRGKDLYAEAKYELAIREFDQALAIDKNLGDAYFNRAIAYWMRRDYDRAIADFSSFLVINPDKAYVLSNRGSAYTLKGQYENAIADFTEALKLQPDSFSTLSNRAAAYALMGDYYKAIADFTACIRIKPDYVYAQYSRGRLYDSLNDYEKAIADYTVCLKAEPNNAEFLYQRGTAYFNKGDNDRAIPDFNAALRIKPDYASALNNRGGAYYNKGEYNRAIADFTASIKIRPDDITTLNNRGKAYYNIGEFDKCIADWEAVQRIEPNDATNNNNLRIAREMYQFFNSGR